MSRKKKSGEDVVHVKGMYRVGIYNADGSVAGLSGWRKNTVTQKGSQLYIVGCIGGVGASSQIAAMAVGSNTATPATGDSTLAHEHARASLAPTLVSNGTLQAVASWASDAFNGQVASVALHAGTSGGSMACGAAFTASTKASDQSLSITYQLRFA